MALGSVEEKFMESKVNYHQQLRSIGQSLEAQRINVFELACRGEQIVVKGEPEKETSLLAALRHWQKQRRSEGMNSSLTFTSQDIDQLERQGRARRSRPNRLPDFHSLANTLRTVGWHLDLKGSQLLEIHKRQLSLSILSRDKNGHPEFEERTIASFYDLFLSLHARRGRPGS
ncbi:MAG: hypothetical protein ACM3SP_03085 [Chloroflexota bacterium]